MSSFRAFRVHKTDAGVEARLETLTLDDLCAGEVVIRGEYSSINYKDALAATGAGRILRKYPLVAGVDIAGTVESSDDPRIAPGQKVCVMGCGLSETHDGGFTERARVRGDWVTPLPDGIDTRTAMAIGTAGYTAAMAIHQMEHCGQRPESGPVAVTGATGGVGSVAIDMLAGRGYEVIAVTSKRESAAYLESLGASSVLLLGDVDFGKRPLETATFAGAIDNLGGDALAWLTRTTRSYGNIAAIGLALGHELNTTVMPFILRGVNLLGINSVEYPRDKRLAIWQRIATDLRPRHLDRVATREVTLDEMPRHFQEWIDGRVTGRTIVRLA